MTGSQSASGEGSGYIPRPLHFSAFQFGLGPIGKWNMLRAVQHFLWMDINMTQVKETYDSAFYSEHGYFHLRPANSHFLRNVEEATRTFHDLIKKSGGPLRTAFKNKDGKIRRLLFVGASCFWLTTRLCDAFED